MESSNAPNAAIEPEEAPKLQIYPIPNTGVSPFWRGKTSSASINTSLLAQFTSTSTLASFYVEQTSTKEKLESIGTCSTNAIKIE